MAIKVAVIGAGGFGRHHVRILSGMEDVELVGAVDPDPSRAKENTDPYGVPLLPSLEDLPDGVEAAVVAVPTEHHLEVAKSLLGRGIGVLVEKPLAKDVEEARAIVDAAEASGAVLGVGHVERFNAAVIAAQDRITEPRFIECRRVAPFSFRSSDIGVVLDLMIHDLDICLALADSELVRVDACGTPVLGEFEDIANARLEFECGCVADITASRVAMKTERKIRLFCPDAYLSLDYAKQSGVLYRKSPKLTPEYVRKLKSDASTIADLRGLVFGNLLSIENLSMEAHDPLTVELKDFLDAVRSGGEPTVSGRDGLRAVDAAVKVLTAIGQSPVLR
jgi:predicted dehydrogenase